MILGKNYCNYYSQSSNNFTFTDNSKKFLFLSDAHFTSVDNIDVNNIDTSFTNYFIKLDYDYFIIVGDSIREEYKIKIIKIIEKIFNAITSKNKILILGNNDNKMFESISQVKSILKGIIVVTEKVVIDNFLFCSTYSKPRTFTSGKYGYEENNLPTKDELDKCKVFVSHGMFSVKKHTCTNKLFVHGHDHICFEIENLKYKNVNYDHLLNPKYLYYYNLKDINNNTFVNVSMSDEYKLNDRYPYFTHIDFQKNQINVELVSRINRKEIYKKSKIFKDAYIEHTDDKYEKENVNNF
jgi:metallophosphoesterase superfamily enzyme